MHGISRGRIRWLLAAVFVPILSFGQSDALTREACVRYALAHSPLLQQRVVDQQIVRKEVSGSLSGWLPQVSIDGALIDNVDKPNIVFPDESGNPVVREIGVAYQSNVTLNASQTLFSNEVLSAARAAPLARRQAEQSTYAARIDLYVAVSKAFFALLTTQDQIQILSEDQQRLEKSVRDARIRYENGIADPVDYKQATIQLNNTKAQLANAQADLPYRRAVLKQRMGYPPDQLLQITYDANEVPTEVAVDTLQTPSYRNRIEYSQLETQAGLLAAAVDRYRWGFLPSLSAFFNYQFNYFNEAFAELYDRSFTSSQLGLRASIPLFQGASRVYNLQAAKLAGEQLAFARAELQNQITTKYAQAIASYRGALTNWRLQQENEQLAREVYQIIQLQYDEGIIPYLEVIQAETDLRSAQLNTSDALLRVLSSKVDLQRATGTVPLADISTTN
jgi:outer membrane protein TolC